MMGRCVITAVRVKQRGDNEEAERGGAWVARFVVFKAQMGHVSSKKMDFRIGISQLYLYKCMTVKKGFLKPGQPHCCRKSIGSFRVNSKCRHFTSCLIIRSTVLRNIRNPSQDRTIIIFITL